jgi:hypothetical protein
MYEVRHGIGKQQSGEKASDGLVPAHGNAPLKSAPFTAVHQCPFSKDRLIIELSSCGVERLWLTGVEGSATRLLQPVQRTSESPH